MHGWRADLRTNESLPSRNLYTEQLNYLAQARADDLSLASSAVPSTVSGGSVNDREMASSRGERAKAGKSRAMVQKAIISFQIITI